MTSSRPLLLGALCALLAAPTPAAIQGVPGEAQPAPRGAYAARFLRGVEAFDAGRFAAAAAAFERAGALAPDAPVWPASAALAAARAGDEAGARERFAAALARGYPPSDLAALCPLGAEVAAAAAPAAAPPDGAWVTVAARGLRRVQGDVRHGRESARVPAEQRFVTHLVGNFTYWSGARAGDPDYLVERFRVDRASGVVAPVELDRRGQPFARAQSIGFSGDQALAWFGIRAFGEADSTDPWPRSVPFARALRTGLLVDERAGGVDEARIDVRFVLPEDGRLGVVARAGGGEVFRLDLARLARVEGAAQAQGEDGPWPGFERVTEPALVARARAARERHAAGEVEVMRLVSDGAPSLLAVAGRSSRRPGGRPDLWLPLVFVDEQHGDEVHRVLAPDLGETDPRMWTWTPILPPRRAPGEGLVLVEHRWRPRMVVLREGDWAQVWPAPTAADGGRGPLGAACNLVLVADDRGGEGGGERAWRTLRRAADGALLLNGVPLGLAAVHGAPGVPSFVGQGDDSLYWFEDRRLDGDRDGTEPLAALWLVDGEVVAVGRDGTWSLPRGLSWESARVLVGDRFVPAEPLAPWLLDPLHVRTLAADADLAPRRFPAP